jgi:hypothetical protein
MLLGDGFVAISLLVLAGIIGFFVMSVALVLRLGGFVLRTLFGSVEDAAPHRAMSGPRSSRALQRAPRGAVLCPHRRCGHLNPSGARFCGRCGRPLSSDHDMDAYA